MAGREVDATDSKVVAAFAAIKDSKQPYNWLSYGFVGGKGPKLELVGTGEGGLAEMQHTFTDDRVIFGLLRVLGADVQANVTSTREKFTYISWIGPKVGVMSRAKVGMQSKAVQAFFVGVSLVISVDASTTADIALEALAKRLLACGGAHKPTKYIFGPGVEQEYSLLDILGAAGPRAGFVSSSDKSPTSPSAAPAAAATEEKKEEAAPAAEAVAAD
jgi:hypothetical protein